jgi:hypothetical protein
MSSGKPWHGSCCNRSPEKEEIAMASAGPRSHVGSTQPPPASSLFYSMAQAARRNDRATFDRLFDCCFECVYAVAWHVTQDAARAEAITAHVMREAMIAAA